MSQIKPAGLPGWPSYDSRIQNMGTRPKSRFSTRTKRYPSYHPRGSRILERLRPLGHMMSSGGAREIHRQCMLFARRVVTRSTELPYVRTSDGQLEVNPYPESPCDPDQGDLPAVCCFRLSARDAYGVGLPHCSPRHRMPLARDGDVVDGGSGARRRRPRTRGRRRRGIGTTANACRPRSRRDF